MSATDRVEKALLDPIADAHADTDLDVERAKEQYSVRLRELLESPEERIPEIIEDMIADGPGRREAIDPAALDDIEEIAALSWEDIHEIELPDRDDVWYTGRAIVFGACDRQAFIEVGLATSSGGRGIELGAGALSAAVSLPRDAVRDAAREGLTRERFDGARERKKNGREAENRPTG